MTYRPCAHVHTGNIVENWRTLCARNPSSETGAVIKANGYGLGAEMVAAALQQAGCRTFFVAYLEEALAVRRVIGKGSRIFVLHGPQPGDLDDYVANNLIAVLCTNEHLAIWQNAPPHSCALHFDTGMNRLGLPLTLLADTGALKALQPVLVMSHLACADEPNHPMNAAQLAAFKTVVASFPDVPASLANSAGCYLEGYGFDLTRPGIALYGGMVPPDGSALKHAVTLEGEIISLFKASSGETIGYGATHELAADALLATVSLGYADGLLRSGSDKLVASFNGIDCPLLGRVSMDLVTLDVSKAQSAIKAGDRIEFLGAHAKLTDQATRSGTLGYELLTGLGQRVQRLYS